LVCSSRSSSGLPFAYTQRDRYTWPVLARAHWSAEVNVSFVRFGGFAAKTNEKEGFFLAAAACPELVEGAKKLLMRPASAPTA
jgi:hypothetical protein